MEGYTLEIQGREGLGSASCRRCRKQGLLPSVVYYSHGEKGFPVAVSEREFGKIARSSKSSQLFTLKSSVSEINGKMAVVKEIQLDHLTGNVLHIDFQALREDEKVAVHVGLRFVGEATGVKLEGGILTTVLHDVKVRCLPKLIPSEIVVDVSDLGLGHSIKLKDIKVPEGVKVEGNPEESVVSVVAVHVVAEEVAAPTAEAAAGAAPAEGAPAAESGAADKKAEGGEKEAKGKEK